MNGKVRGKERNDLQLQYQVVTITRAVVVCSCSATAKLHLQLLAPQRLETSKDRKRRMARSP
eukprot:scaffold4973_cov111-Skeletonema_marinoi.AAC.3